VIINLQKFVETERPHWSELEAMLDRLEKDPHTRLPLAQVRHFHHLYERTSADLARITTFASEPDLRRYLESLVARAYGEIHEARSRQHRVSPFVWFFRTLPQTFRRHVRAFHLAVAITAVGVAFGALATVFDPDSRGVTMPFGHGQLDPAERVAREERGTDAALAGRQGSFSAWLMTHNTRVAVLTLALGMTWGVGTLLVLFQNGVGLGAISVDYLQAGQGKFLLGWLMPHGVVEIPAILIAGQAGLMLAGALIGRGRRDTLRVRLRAMAGDLVTLICGVAIMLVWAGLVEAFFSQYHEPVLPYAVKIAFGAVELVLLVCFLTRAGLKPPARPAELEIRNPQLGTPS
jgi:uncharacterized membrane protein SpoIIM required for sporulation